MNKYCIHHKNGNPRDNSPDNLEIVDIIHNARRKAGRPRVIDAATVARLRADPAGFTWKQIAERLRVAESSVIRVYREYRNAKV